MKECIHGGLMSTWKNIFRNHTNDNEEDYQVDDYKTLLRYVNKLASHKMGYPVHC